jgi:hypothetical protein
MSRKLNQQLTAVPAAAVLTSAWLKCRGISSRLADYYCRSGWLHRVGDGAFTIKPGTPSWLGAVHGLQQKPTSIHPGGRTALEIFGRAHFIPWARTIRSISSAEPVNGSRVGLEVCHGSAACGTFGRDSFLTTSGCANTATESFA